MDGLTFIGHCIFFTIGFGLGVAAMYFVPLLIEWIDDWKIDD